MEQEKRGAPIKFLSKEQILEAMSKTLSNRAAARYLGVSYIHYKKYAKSYLHEDGRNLFDVHLNRQGRGIPKHLTGRIKKINLIDLIEGRLDPTHFNTNDIKDKLFEMQYVKEECSYCGFHERRILDFKVPLILHFKDGDKTNYNLQNLEVICYNCYFLMVGNVFSKKKMEVLENYIPKPEGSLYVEQWQVHQPWKPKQPPTSSMNLIATI